MYFIFDNNDDHILLVLCEKLHVYALHESFVFAGLSQSLQDGFCLRTRSPKL